MYHINSIEIFYFFLLYKVINSWPKKLNMINWYNNGIIGITGNIFYNRIHKYYLFFRLEIGEIVWYVNLLK